MENIIQERKTFVEEMCAPAIATIIKLAYGDKLKKVEKNNTIFAERILNSKRCLNFVCKGVLETKGGIYVCNACKETFCTQCEKESQAYHVCKPEDVASMEEINAMVKCPKCALPVVKSNGCNAITCAICRTNFDYISGQKQGSGNHTNDAAITLRQHDTLTSVYGSEYKKSKIKELLYLIDTKCPKIPNTTSFTSFILKKGVEMNANDKITLSHRYAKYLKDCKRSQSFARHTSKIKALHETKKLNVDALEDILMAL